MNYTKLRKDCVKDKNNFILYAFTGATVNFKATNNTARDDDAELDLDLDTDLDTDDTTTSTTAATTATTSSTGGVTWDNVLDGITSIASNPTTTATTATGTQPVTTTGSTTGISTELKGLQDLFVKYNVPIRITSDYRKGATTKQGRQSYHATGHAMDIVPLDGHDFAEISRIIRETPEIKNYMQQHGYGVLDETTQDMLARTGGTGAHYHIGRDKIAQNFWNV